MKSELKKLPQSEVEISVSLPAETLMSHWNKALAEVRKLAEVDGFRKGHVPEDVFLSRFGDMAVLEEAAHMAIDEVYPKLLDEHKLRVIDHPEIRITKLAKDNPLEFIAKVAVLPDIKLPNYKKIAGAVATTKAPEVTDKEVDDVLEELRKGRKEKDTDTLPELTDAFAQSVGTFKTVAELREKIKENLQKEKDARENDKRRLAILDAIQKETSIEIPNTLVENEVERMFAQLRADVAQFGGNIEGYLTHMKKTEEDLKKEWRGEAERRAKIQLIIATIAKEEKLVPEEEEIEHELEHLKEHHKDIDDKTGRNYVYQVLQNEKVLKFLEA
jgi:FKBP-type peptidyl-prolyl cis-trans isomerase (trigger factor)